MSQLVSVVKRTVWGLFLLPVLLAVAMFWVMATESGLQAGAALARSLIPAGVQFDSVGGQLLGPLQLNGLTVKTDAATISLRRLRLDWQPQELLRGLVHLQSLQVSGVRVDVHDTSPDDAAEPLALPVRLVLPVDLRVADLVVDDVLVYRGDEKFVMERLRAEAQWIDTAFALADLSVTAPMLDLVMSGQVTTESDYPLELRIATTLKQALAVPAVGDLALTARGSLSDLDLRGSAEIAGESVPELSIGLAANLQTSAADLSDYRLAAKLTIAGQDIDPAIYLEQLSGNVALGAVVDVVQHRGGVAQIEVSEISAQGELEGAELVIGGSGSWTGNAGAVNEFRASWGDYELTANGRLGAESNLAWAIELADLSRAGKLLGGEWQGALSGRGQLLGALDSPQVVAQVVATDLLVQGVGMRSAELEANLSSNGDIKLNLFVAEVQMSGESVDELALTVRGTRQDHQLSLVVDSPRAEVALVVNGSLQDSKVWTFDLAELDLLHPDFDSRQPDHRWRLVAPARGEVAKGRFTLLPLCLAQLLPEEDGELCIDAALAQGKLAANLVLERLGLANLNGLLDADTRVAGLVSGEAHWTGAVASTSGAFALTDVELSTRQNAEWLRVAEFSPGTLSLVPEDGVMRLKAELPLRADTSKGVFAAVSAGTAIDANTQSKQLSGAVSGKLRVELPDLGWLAAFSEQVELLSGSLVSQVTLAGTLEAPLLTGVTQLDLPEIRFAELDLVLLDTRLILDGTPDSLRLTGKSRSGDGSIALNSNVSWAGGLQVTGTLQGENFAVSNSAEARINVSPDLEATYANQTLKLRGDVDVPVARITLDKMPDGAVVASRDQRFPEGEQANAPLATDVLIRLTLGEEVSFEGLGLSADFSGALSVRDLANQTTTAIGEIEIIEGTYKAYGQKLSIQNGSLVFAGGPVDEPGLNVRAVRQTTTEIEVGVHVQGSLRQPKLEIFSSPSLPQTDQLSYLLLGRPLTANSASENSIMQQAVMALGVEGGQLVTGRIGKSLGVDTFSIESAPGTSNAQAALVVGKYLSPKLYVSYGYGLFEPLSTLRLEYQLGRLWRIVTESTNVATGGDLLWVHER